MRSLRRCKQKFGKALDDKDYRAVEKRLQNFNGDPLAAVNDYLEELVVIERPSFVNEVREEVGLPPALGAPDFTPVSMFDDTAEPDVVAEAAPEAPVAEAPVEEAAPVAEPVAEPGPEVELQQEKKITKSGSKVIQKIAEKDPSIVGYEIEKDGNLTQHIVVFEGKTDDAGASTLIANNVKEFKERYKTFTEPPPEAAAPEAAAPAPEAAIEPPALEPETAEPAAPVSPIPAEEGRRRASLLPPEVEVGDKRYYVRVDAEEGAIIDATIQDETGAKRTVTVASPEDLKPAIMEAYGLDQDAQMFMVPDPDTVPLEDITVTENFVDENGQEGSIVRPADEALSEVDMRINNLKMLVGCLRR